MPFSQRYNSLILEKKNIGKRLIKPKNIYKIDSYKYADGDVKSLSGKTTSLIFCLGIFDGKVSCIKIGNLQPNIFFRWIKPILKKGLTAENFDDYESLSDLCIDSDLRGSKLFNSFVKNSTIYNIDPSLYRTYNLSGIKIIEEVKLSAESLKKAYGIKEIKK
jgi:hypothetical protein